MSWSTDVGILTVCSIAFPALKAAGPLSASIEQKKAPHSLRGLSVLSLSVLPRLSRRRA